MYNKMAVGCSSIGSTVTTIKQWYGFHTGITQNINIRQLSQIQGNFCGLSTTREGAQTPLIYTQHGCGMQFNKFNSLNHSIVAWLLHWHHLGYQPALTNLGKVFCGGNGVSVPPFTHPQHQKVLTTLYMYNMAVGCSLIGSSASTLALVVSTLTSHMISASSHITTLGKCLWL